MLSQPLTVDAGGYHSCSKLVDITANASEALPFVLWIEGGLRCYLLGWPLSIC